MYGCAVDIEVIESICRTVDECLINAAAQTVDIVHGGRLLGDFGDVSILRFS